MKNILNYYYKLIVDDSKINNGYFSYNNHLFCLYEYRRNINEIDALDYLNNIMISRNVYINKIIRNVFDRIITYHDNKSYVLIMINYEYQDNLNIMFVMAMPYKALDILKRNNWGRLWSLKIDYIEYQIGHLKNSFPLVNNSVNYYIGLAENAISYFNMLDLNGVPLYISHRRINKDNIYNPLELVIDYKARDIAEYIKYNFFYENMSIDEIKDYLNNFNLENIDYVLLYVRLIYPSFYFDLYEEIVNNGKDENELKRVIELSSLYEKLIFEIYNMIRKKVSILGVDWINKKFM